MRIRSWAVAAVLATCMLGSAVPALATPAGIHLELGAADGNGCQPLEVYNDATLLGTVPQELSPRCMSNTETFALPNGNLVFDWSTNGYDLGARIEVWGTDGTVGSVKKLATQGVYGCNTTREVVGRMLVLAEACNDPGPGATLTATRGTPATTMVLPGFDAGHRRGYGGYRPPFYVPFLDGIIYAAEHPTKGRELYRSNGTPSRTRLLRDIRPGAAGSFPENLVVTPDGKRVRFVANGGGGRVPYVTDGTRAGTHIVHDRR
ncbi:MAG: hypothetical protein U0869_21405 [Chloroflexota bacterium]